MPEGDTLFRTATMLRKALLGKPVTRFEAREPHIAIMDGRRPVAGRLIEVVEARGKNLLIVFRQASMPDDVSPITTPAALGLTLYESDLVLHSHLRMSGSWHIYRPGEVWRKPDSYAKCVIHTEDFVAICFSAPLVELLTARETARHKFLGSLGPDAMTDSFDPEEAFARIRKRPDVPIGVAIMVQSAIAGVGNVFKSEVLFIQRTNPFALVRDLSDDNLRALITESHKLLQLNDTRGERRTRFALNANERLWVYGRSGEACRVCGERVRLRRQGLEGRTTYYCPNCQNVGQGEHPPNCVSHLQSVLNKSSPPVETGG